MCVQNQCLVRRRYRIYKACPLLVNNFATRKARKRRAPALIIRKVVRQSEGQQEQEEVKEKEKGKGKEKANSANR